MSVPVRSLLSSIVAGGLVGACVMPFSKPPKIAAGEIARIELGMLRTNDPARIRAFIQAVQGQGGWVDYLHTQPVPTTRALLFDATDKLVCSVNFQLDSLITDCDADRVVKTTVALPEKIRVIEGLLAAP
jgi:hypothetical protein